MGRTTRLARRRVIGSHRRRQDAAPSDPRGAGCASSTRPHGIPADAGASSRVLSYHQQCPKRLSRPERPVRRTCPVSHIRRRGDRRPKARKRRGNSGYPLGKKSLYINVLRGGGGNSHQRTILHLRFPVLQGKYSEFSRFRGLLATMDRRNDVY